MLIPGYSLVTPLFLLTKLDEALIQDEASLACYCNTAAFYKRKSAEANRFRALCVLMIFKMIRFMCCLYMKTNAYSRRG